MEGGLLGCFVTLVIAAGLSCLSAWLFMSCWNAVVPSSFNGPEFDFTKSLASVILISFVTRGIRASGSKS